jgi:hypothetical protein
MKKGMGEGNNDSRYLMKNPTPKILLEGVDYRVQTVEERVSGVSTDEDPFYVS